MKIAIIGDLHFGAKNDSQNFHYMFDNYFRHEFIPYLVENNIHQVIQLGDLFDKRRTMCFNTLAECKRYFFRPLEEAGITLHTLIGNHDIYFRQSLSVNSSGLVLGEFKNIHIYDKPSTIQLASTTIDIIPWICDENKEDVLDYISKSKSDLCCGHFEIEHFKMNKDMPAQDGLSQDIFIKYESVWSGHYHTKSDRGNIHYVGTPYELTWSDYNDPKSFQVFDTKTRQIENIASNGTMFYKHEYDDVKYDYPTMDYSVFFQKYIKIVVINKTDAYNFDMFLKKLYSVETYEIKILEDLSDFSDGVVTGDVKLEETVDMLDAYIDSVADDTNRNSIKTFIKSIYLEALDKV